MRKKEMMRLLEERAERIVALEQRLEKSSSTIETYRMREQTIIDSLAAAQTESKQRIADAQQKADDLIGRARQMAESATQAAEVSANEIVAKAEAYRDELVKNARAQAEAMLANAKEKSSSILAQTQAAVAEYEEALVRYNALIEESAATAREKAQQYAAFLQTQRLTPPELTKTAEGLSVAPYAPEIELPDAEDNPAQLMRNIYTLEKREIPEEAAEQPAYPTPSVEPETQKTIAEPEKQEASVEPENYVLITEMQAEELPEAELSDLAPHPVSLEIEEAPVSAPNPAPKEAFEPDAEEELPDLAPRPEPQEWKPEDEAAEPEWQPEMDADEADAPKVSELMNERPVDDEVELSLDALLDEIIRAGE